MIFGNTFLPTPLPPNLLKVSGLLIERRSPISVPTVWQGKEVCKWVFIRVESLFLSVILRSKALLKADNYLFNRDSKEKN